jgi:hypothetical protein
LQWNLHHTKTVLAFSNLKKSSQISLKASVLKIGVTTKYTCKFGVSYISHLVLRHRNSENLCLQWKWTGLENREYGHRDPLCLPRNTLYLQTSALASPISGGLSVGIVRSRTKATELVVFFSLYVLFIWFW